MIRPVERGFEKATQTIAVTCVPAGIALYAAALQAQQPQLVRPAGVILALGAASLSAYLIALVANSSERARWRKRLRRVASAARRMRFRSPIFFSTQSSDSEPPPADVSHTVTEGTVQRRQHLITGWRGMVADLMERVNHGDTPLWLLERDRRFLDLEPLLLEEEREKLRSGDKLEGTTLPTPMWVVKNAIGRIEREWESDSLTPFRQLDAEVGDSVIERSVAGHLTSLEITIEESETSVAGVLQDDQEKSTVVVVYLDQIRVLNHDLGPTKVERIWLEFDKAEPVRDAEENQQAKWVGEPKIAGRDSQIYSLEVTQLYRGTFSKEEALERVHICIAALGFGVVRSRIPASIYLSSK